MKNEDLDGLYLWIAYSIAPASPELVWRAISPMMSLQLELDYVVYWAQCTFG